MAAALSWLGLAATFAAAEMVMAVASHPHPHPRPMPPPLPHLPAERTCAAGSPAALLPFCDQEKSHAARAGLLSVALTTEERITLWALHSYHYPIARLNIKGLHRDTCCVHGPALNFFDGPWAAPGLQPPLAPNFVTVFPHAINHGAMFDLDLVARISNATGNEMRAASQIRYRTSAGQAFAAVVCDSGPLANTAHNPAWGRISETYGEDPYLVARTGVMATQAMQSVDKDSGVLKTALTTRHYIGYHHTDTMPVPSMNVTERDLHDAYLPGYEAFQTEAEADGIMCGFSSFDGVPSCASKRLLTDVLKHEWASDAVVQSDCCDSLTSIKTVHNYTETYPQAVAAAFNAGLDLCFGCDRHLDKFPSGNASQFLASALDQSLVRPEQLEAAVARIMLTRFKLGEFDEPPAPPVDESLLDSAEHRALAREAASASCVLVHNKCDDVAGGDIGVAPLSSACALPVMTSAAPKKIAVIGPFANCSAAAASHGGGDAGVGLSLWSGESCYLHSYAGLPSSIVSVLDAIAEDATRLGASLTFELGTTDVAALGPDGIKDAAAAAAAADLVVLAVGLGSNVEKEGLDRANLTLPDVQAELLAAVRAATTGRLIVVCVSAGGVYIDPSLADAILYAGYGGEEAGHGVADIIFGRVSPSARLPITVYAEDYLDHVGPMSDFSTTSGVGRTYRYLDVAKSPPLWQFGFGLSFSKFVYSNITIDTFDKPDVWVSATVTNVGTVDAHEVAQLYVSVPGAGATEPNLPIPLRSLQGFTRQLISTGRSLQLSFKLGPSQYSTVRRNGTRAVTTGNYTVSVGGAQPGDPAARKAGGNAVTGTFTVA